MTIADDIDRLAAQRAAGHLTEDEFIAAKARLFTQAPPQADIPLNALRRSTGDRWIGGVCGGIARLTGIESWIVRLLFAVAILFGGFGFIPYILLWIFVPSDNAPLVRNPSY